ncbi:hypothetical protein BC835DRAFT_1521643 [Cytidiella melzeri]|nr:hypothetical protein BC835DRAFT_1521643 [Cytidiella melzeri]
MWFSTSLVLLTAIVTGPFYTVAISARPYFSTNYGSSDNPKSWAEWTTGTGKALSQRRFDPSLLGSLPGPLDNLCNLDGKAITTSQMPKQCKRSHNKMLKAEKKAAKATEKVKNLQREILQLQNRLATAIDPTKKDELKAKLEKKQAKLKKKQAKLTNIPKDRHVLPEVQAGASSQDHPPPPYEYK